ncbi:alkaline phosphatase family protein [Sphingobacterium sp. KU25419]|nr:alkaline phosphatase family protein [Sphingobacterium sp. KU25419]
MGHRYSLSSVEIEDIYLKLDHELADLFNYLDKTVGAGNYTFFLTADHAASYNSRYFMDMKGNGGYFPSRQIITALNDNLKAKFGQEKLVKSLMNYQVHLDNEKIETLKLDEEAIKTDIIKYLKKQDGVAFVFDMSKGDALQAPLAIREKAINGYNIKRSGVIQIVVEPQWYDGTPRSTGTTHGTWSSFDSHTFSIYGLGHQTWGI